MKLNSPNYPMIDSHLHVTDFLGRSEGFKNLIYHMDKNNITKSVIFGTSVQKIRTEEEREMPEYYLDDDNKCYYNSFVDTYIATEYLKLNNKEKERLYPLLCGFNPMDINSIEYIKKMFSAFPGVFYGIGEVLYRHDDLTHMTEGNPPRMNTKATEKLLEFSSMYDIPVLFHNNITSPQIKHYPKFLYEMESVIKKYPRAKIIWAHCGASRRLNIPNYIKIIERILREYENLYIDLSWVVFDEIVNKNRQTVDDWVLLSKKYNNRILIGSDVLGGGFHKIGIINGKFNNFLSKLNEEERLNITINNAEFLYKKSNIKNIDSQKIEFPKLFK